MRLHVRGIIRKMVNSGANKLLFDSTRIAIEKAVLTNPVIDIVYKV